MYRKEQCLSLLEDPEDDDAGNIDENGSERKPALKLHKVISNCIFVEWYELIKLDFVCLKLI